MPDAVERVTGTVPFLINLEVPKMLQGNVLRSPLPHARIASIDTRAAESLPGVEAVLSGNDFGSDSPLDPNFGSVLKDHQIVAIEKVRYVGEPVAVVAAVDAETAEAALDLIEVEYEELPAVFTALEAVQKDAPLVHEGLVKTYSGSSPADGNIVRAVRIRHGDVAQGFVESDYIFEHTFTTPQLHHAALEPHVAVAQVADGQVTIWTATQAPYKVRDRLASIFGLPPEQVRVIAPPVGGGFGAKSHIKIEGLAAALAWKANGRPVKIMLSRAESFSQIVKHAATLTLKTGVNQDGTLVARQATIHWNAGAYSDTSPIVAKNGAITCFGPYRWAHSWSDSLAVYTNTPPAGSYRGPAVLEVTWAGESQIDIIARELGLDPVELRLKNLLEDGDTFITGETMHGLHYKELLRETAVQIGWGKSVNGKQYSVDSDGLVQGKGVAVTMKSTTTPSTSKANICLDGSGLCTLLVSTVELGQGSKIVLSQIAADALGIPLERIRIVNPDTNLTPFDAATNSSRSTFSMGNALRLAAQDLKRQLRETAAALWEANPSDLVVEGETVSVRGSPEFRLNWGKLVRQSGEEMLTGQADFTTKGGLDLKTYRGVASVHWHQGVGAAEVALDPETGKVIVTNFHAATYAGQVIHPHLAALQTEGNVIMGLGLTLGEEIVFDSGQIVNANLGDYLVPSIVDLPASLTTHEMEAPDGQGELHGVAESTIPTVAPAIANAIAASTAVRLFDLPLTPEKIVAKLKGMPENGAK